MSIKLAVLNNDGKSGTPVSASEQIFGADYNEPLIHEVVTGLLANSRSDTSMQKNRSACRGGGRKPWQPPGLGRARAGTIRSPLWRGGGATFGGQQALHQQKIKKKAYRSAVRSSLSELVRQEKVFIVDGLTLSEPKTKVLKSLLGTMNLNNVLILMDTFDETLFLASRNIPYVDVMTVEELYPVSLLAYEKLVLTSEALKQIEEWLS